MLEHCNFFKIENICPLIVSHSFFNFRSQSCIEHAIIIRDHVITRYHWVRLRAQCPKKYELACRHAMIFYGARSDCVVHIPRSLSGPCLITVDSALLVPHRGSRRLATSFLIPESYIQHRALISMLLPSVKHTPRRMTPNTPNRDQKPSKGCD